MTQSTDNAERFDPYKNFKFRVKALTPSATWHDIVLPTPETALLRQIADQVSARARTHDDRGVLDQLNRGVGITALFAGESGTGKSMAAEVLANELKFKLFRIDLSAVISKFVDETEKNLRQLFDAMADDRAILLLDEADALFGKRSEVKDAHDRYANIEVNYLLQRIEAYRGLTILSTNRKSALDPVFIRRLRFVVNFPSPAAPERRQIWKKQLAERVPVRDLDYDRLASIALTGGTIHNIARSAASLAAQAGSNLTMPIVLDAARTELRKLDRPLNEADLGQVGPA